MGKVLKRVKHRLENCSRVLSLNFNKKAEINIRVHTVFQFRKNFSYVRILRLLGAITMNEHLGVSRLINVGRQEERLKK